MPTRCWRRLMTPPVSRVPTTGVNTSWPGTHPGWGGLALGGRRGGPPPPALATLKDAPVTNASTNETETKLTQATYDRLQAELEDLTTRGRVEIASASSRPCSRRRRWSTTPTPATGA